MKVGQEVYVRKIGNSARHIKSEDLITKEIVEKVGNKYFYLKDFCRTKFGREEMCDISEYASNFVVYESLQEIKDENEFIAKSDDIKKVFQSYGKVGLSLDQIRRIYDIIHMEEKK
jgi:hypothetical protein